MPSQFVMVILNARSFLKRVVFLSPYFTFIPILVTCAFIRAGKLLSIDELYVKKSTSKDFALYFF